MVKQAAKTAQIRMNRRALEGLGFGTMLAAGFFAVGVVVSGGIGFWYLVWNLFLAYIPLALTYPLLRSLSRRGWGDWRTVLWGLLWLVWLPNSFYVLTDVAHLFDHGYGLDPLFGVALFSLFAGLGVAAGYVSLLPVHLATARRYRKWAAYATAEFVLLVCSVAVYVGRTMRWNSWDVVLHPVRLVQSLVTGLLAFTYLEVTTILTFFVLLSGLYLALWHVFGEHE